MMGEGSHLSAAVLPYCDFHATILTEIGSFCGADVNKLRFKASI